jgi:iron complex transport system substrate-binding protein
MRMARLIGVAMICAIGGGGNGFGPAYAQNAPPGRVVSINLCTDQLAMMLAAPGQLVSVSYLAHDPRYSPMADAAPAYAPNRALAEDVYLMDPDLVIANTFSNPATLSILRRLGVPVVTFDPAYSIADVRDRITQMGVVLHRQDAARTMIAAFDHDLAALASRAPAIRPLAALYYANSYTAGDRSLAGQILSLAGFDNAAVQAGLPQGGVFALEVLVLSNPDAVITGQRYPATSRSEQVLDHPVLRALTENRMQGHVTDRDWVCGTPHLVRAIDNLLDMHVAQGPGQ